ncbi:hypothetical protein M378DRAFT_168438, partial [Amanita muscaria Koide BX008]
MTVWVVAVPSTRFQRTSVQPLVMAYGLRHLTWMTELVTLLSPAPTAKSTLSTPLTKSY